MKLWEKGYGLNRKIETFTVGNDYVLDRELLKYDCLASIAHARMLKKIKMLNRDECSKLVSTLEEIMELDRLGRFVIRQKDEDCHTAIENHLVKRLGSIGKKIHTARSRNDQVLAALRLYCREEVRLTLGLIDKLVNALALFKKKYGRIAMPGYTHMRKAMPSSAGLWAHSFVESMKDNSALLLLISRLVDQSPLGTGAGYPLPLRIDRKITSRLLKFRRIQKNPIYVQNSRGKFESSLLHALSQIMADLNRMSCDIIMFSMPEFGYFELSYTVCTGSSIMPHKKNPDALELVRAKYHEVLSCEFGVKNITGNLISGYSRDLQMTKEPTMRGFRVTKECLVIMSLILKNLKVNKDNCKKGLTRELYATHKAYDLVRKGMAFRDAYREISEEF